MYVSVSKDGTRRILSRFIVIGKITCGLDFVDPSRPSEPNAVEHRVRVLGSLQARETEYWVLLDSISEVVATC